VGLFRDLLFVAVGRRDMALLGKTLSMAASCGYSLQTVLGNVGNVSSLMNEIGIQFQQSPWFGQASHAHKFLVLPIAGEPLPSAAAWIASPPPELMAPFVTFVKRSINGHETFFTNNAHHDLIMSREDIAAQWTAAGHPVFADLIHPDDLEGFVATLTSLWEGLEPTVGPSGAAEQACKRNFPPVQLRLKSGEFVATKGAAQLIVSDSEPGINLNYVVFGVHLIGLANDERTTKEDAAAAKSLEAATMAVAEMAADVAARQHSKTVPSVDFPAADALPLDDLDLFWDNFAQLIRGEPEAPWDDLPSP
jgi:hypothetical protein